MEQKNFTRRKNIGKIYGIKNEPDYESLGLTNNAKCFYNNARQKIISRIKDVLDSLKYSNTLIEELHTDKDQPNSESVTIELFSVLCVISAIFRSCYCLTSTLIHGLN